MKNKHPLRNRQGPEAVAYRNRKRPKPKRTEPKGDCTRDQVAEDQRAELRRVEGSKAGIVGRTFEISGPEIPEGPELELEDDATKHQEVEPEAQSGNTTSHHKPQRFVARIIGHCKGYTLKTEALGRDLEESSKDVVPKISIQLGEWDRLILQGAIIASRPTILGPEIYQELIKHPTPNSNFELIQVEEKHANKELAMRESRRKLGEDRLENPDRGSYYEGDNINPIVKLPLHHKANPVDLQ